MPLEDQFYMGFYNKALFKKAGITCVPRDWSQLVQRLHEARQDRRDARSCTALTRRASAPRRTRSTT